MKKKINFIIPGIIKSGGMNVIIEYSSRLIVKGYDVVLYYPLAYYNLSTGKNEYSLNPKRMSWTFQNYFNGIKNKKLIKDVVIKGVPIISDNFVRDADYVFATSWPTAFDVSKMSSSKGIKYYFIQDIETWDSNINLVYESYKLDLKRITICNYLKNRLLNDHGLVSEVILNGIDYSVYFPYINKYYDTYEKTISYIDYKLNKKNTESVIDAVKKIKSEYSSLRFISFGLERYHNHPDFVSFHKNPTQEEISKIYNESHIFIYASKEEGFGLPPAEAMACKTSVVSTRVGAVPEYSIDNQSVLFTANTSSESVYEKVKLLVSDNILNKSISENGYESVRKVLNWENSLEKFISMLI